MRTSFLSSSTLHRDTSSQIGRRHLLLSGAGALLAGGLLTGCGIFGGFSRKNSLADEGGDGAPAVADPSGEAFADLTQALTDIEAGTYQVSVSIYEFPTDEFPDGIQYNFHPEYHTYEASVSKVSIALATLRYLNENGLPLEDDIYSQLNASLGYSDNTSTQALFSMLGDGDSEASAAYLNATYDLLGITTTRSDGDWGVNLTTSHDQVIVARAVNDGVDWVRAEDLERVREIMLATDESQTWGVGAAADELGSDYVLCKNGWIQDENTWQWYINSMGIVNLNDRRYALCVLNFGAQPDDQEGGQNISSQVANKVLDYFNQF